MKIHLILLLYILLLGFFVYVLMYKRGHNTNKFFVIASFLPVFIIETLRADTVGEDTLTYLKGYIHVNTLHGSWEEQTWEKAYLLLNIAVGKISNCNQQLLLGAVSLIILFGVGYFIIENCDGITAFGPVYFFVTLNHYLTSMVSLRQYCALAIGINAYTILRKKDSLKSYIQALILIGIAILFHNTAFVLIIIPFLMHFKKVERKHIIITICSIRLIIVLFTPILNMFYRIFPLYYRYSLMGHAKYSGRSLGKVYIALLILKTLCLLSVFYLSPQNTSNKDLYRLSIFSALGAGISLMTTRIFIVWRFGYYFDIFLILMLPKLAKKFVGISGLFVNSVFYLFGLSYYIFLLFANSSGCIPYKFFWS